MKKVVFPIANRRFEVELEDGFAEFLSTDLFKNGFSLEKDNDINQLLGLYLKALHKEYVSSEQIEILLNKLEGSSWK